VGVSSIGRSVLVFQLFLSHWVFFKFFFLFLCHFYAVRRCNGGYGTFSVSLGVKKNTQQQQQGEREKPTPPLLTVSTRWTRLLGEVGVRPWSRFSDTRVRNDKE
jgi:hypothetical protein